MAYDPSGIIVAGLQMASNQATNQINAERAVSDMATYLNLIHKQREWQKEDQQWNESYAKRIQDYLYQNYNSPSAQMEAYKKAGLNPWLMAQGGDVGSGQSASAPSAPTTSHGSVSPFQRPTLGNTFEGVADKLFGASSLASQRLSALSEMAKAIPDLVRGIGSKASRSLLQSLFGESSSTETIDKMIDIQIGRDTIAKNREDLALQIEQMYGKDKAALINQNLIYEGVKLCEEVNKLASDQKVNDASIKELITRAAKNVAEKSKLNADTETVNQLRPFVVKSANMQADMDEYDAIESETDFIQRRSARAWQRSPEGVSSATAAQTVSDNPETNLVNKIIHAKDPSRRRSRR